MSPWECQRSRPSTPSLGPWSWGWAKSVAKPGTSVGSTPAAISRSAISFVRTVTSSAAMDGTVREQKAVVSTVAVVSPTRIRQEVCSSPDEKS